MSSNSNTPRRSNTILEDFKSLVDQDRFNSLPITQQILVLQKLTQAGDIIRRYTGVK